MFRRHDLLVAGCALVMLCGCVAYHPKPLSAADNARALESRSLQDPRLQQFVAAALSSDDQPATGWRWHLATLTLAALYYHPDIQVAQARFAGAQAAVITARQPHNPVLHLGTAIATAAVAGAIPAAAAPITIGPVLDFILETAGKREARTERAKRLADAARWEIGTAAWQVRGHVRDALLDLWSAEHRMALTRRQLALQEELVSLLQDRLAAGAVAASEVAQERIRRAQGVLAVAELDRAAADARVRLAAAIGMPVSGLDGARLGMQSFDAPPAVSAPRPDWRRAALTGRSDVQSSLADYEAAQDAVKLAVAGQYPDLTLGPGYNYDLGVNRYMLDISATLPILQQEQGPIAEALARRREAAAAFTKTQAQAIAAIDAAEADYRSSARAVTAGDSVLADERRSARQVASAFRAGDADRPALVSSQLVIVAAELARFDAVVRQRRALGALEDALQRPLFEPDTMLSLPPADLAS